MPAVPNAGHGTPTDYCRPAVPVGVVGAIAAARLAVWRWWLMAAACRAAMA